MFSATARYADFDTEEIWSGKTHLNLLDDPGHCLPRATVLMIPHGFSTMQMIFQHVEHVS